AHIDYIRYTQGEAATLRKIVERVNLVSSASGLMSQDNTKNNRIRQTQKKAKKNKVEDHLRTVKSSLNKASVVDSKVLAVKLVKCWSFNIPEPCIIYGNYPKLSGPKYRAKSPMCKVQPKINKAQPAPSLVFLGSINTPSH
nr:hypothetical protein [Tanacetum cinerariifolium]